MSLQNLVSDIYKRLGEAKQVSPDLTEAFGRRLSELVSQRLSEEKTSVGLRLSKLGAKCLRKLWYENNSPELAEPLPGPTRMKFMIGDIIEEVILFLAEVCGYPVSERQTTLHIDGIPGHCDGLIEGTIIDVKSASKYAFEKFQTGLTPSDDAFGYLEQLGSYKKATRANKAAFIAVDKSSGEICIDEHGEDLNFDFPRIIAEQRAAISGPLPERAFSDEPEGKSGNRRLVTYCSYCPFKAECWPGLRGFAYANGPKFLTHVSLVPLVPEIKNGKSN